MEAPNEEPQPREGVLDVPKDRVGYIKQEQLRSIQKLCQRSMKIGRIPTADDGKDVEPALVRLDQFLRWLSTNIDITPELKAATKIDQALRLIFADPRFFFEESVKTRAEELYNRWESQNWGRGELEAEASSDSDTGTNAPSNPGEHRTNSANAANRVILGSIIRPPPANHAIFGVNGIMHGTVQKKTGNRKDFILDNHYQKRDAKVFGHNNLTPGDWRPMQLVTLFNGAHGVKQGGISGNSETGAYSIVISGQYHDLDQDNGEVVYYSGLQSHENEDPNRPGDSSRATQALRASLRSGRPVRVLRASKGKSRWAPMEGYRYDGLYRVVSEDTPLNKKGGMYERFKLVRQSNQPDLEGLRARPTPREVEDMRYIHAGY